MSLALLNSLLAEAGAGSTELAARAKAGAAAAGEVVEKAQALGLKAVDEAERLHREYTEAIAAVKHATEQSNHAAEAALEAVESVNPEALKGATALKDMLVAVEGGLHHLGEERSRVFSGLGPSTEILEATLRELAQRLHVFETRVEERLQGLESSLELGQATVGAAVEKARAASDMLGMAAGEFAAHAKDVTEATEHGLEQILSGICLGVLKLWNDAVSGHNQLVAAVGQYVDETKADPAPAQTYLSATFDTVREAVTGFELLPEPAESSLQSAMATIVTEGEKALGGLGDAVTSLQHSVEVVTP